MRRLWIVASILLCGCHEGSEKGPRTTPLVDAVSSGDLVGVDRLLKADADPNVVLYNGETALTRAVRSHSLDMVELLIQNGADVKKRYPYDGPLDIAIREKDARIEKVLRDKGAM